MLKPVLSYSDNSKFVSTDEIIIQLKSNIDLKEILTTNAFNFTKNEFNENQYLVKLNNVTTQELFTKVNSLKQDARIAFVEPNFKIFSKMFASDPYQSSQWSIQNNGYLGGTIGADMKVASAWGLATGQGIKVAVLDSGVDLTHEDLQANLLQGFDAYSGTTNGGIGSAENLHGTPCAGIIGAVKDNNKGIVGVSYNAKIIPVKIAEETGSFSQWVWSDITSPVQIANGVSWAWQTGNADVLSCSWRCLPFAVITQAINNATALGRGGKGAIILVSSGNYVPISTDLSITYPSYLPNVISVGATSQCDRRKSLTSCDGDTDWGSRYGIGLDIVAPGVQIYTTDIMGVDGYNTGNYRSDFLGTSAACPNAAGVMALILSANPTLTLAEARNVIESTTDKITGTTPSTIYNYTTNPNQPNGTWNQEVGYGRINAFRAVQLAKVANLAITGNPSVCPTSNTYSLLNYSTGVTTVWTATSNLILSNITNGSVTVSTNPTITNSPLGTLTATVNGIKVLTKTITRDVPTLSTNPVNASMWIRKNYYPVQMYLTPNNSATSYLWTIEADPDNYMFPCTGVTARFTDVTATNNGTTLSTNSNQPSINFGSCVGAYIVTCDAVNDCGNTPQFYKYITVGRTGTNPCNIQSESLKIAPNPIKEGETLVSIIIGDFPCNYDTPFAYYKNSGINPDSVVKEVRIFDSNGEQVYSKTYYEEDAFTIKGLNLKKASIT
jgi:subtilisin family serine protease